MVRADRSDMSIKGNEERSHSEGRLKEDSD